jgi:thiamine biosynthesis lipoprotein
MSCGASVVVVASPAAHDLSEALASRALARLHELEQRWSRFLPTSEISGLNDAAGEPRRASTDTVRLVETLVQAWHATQGSFDPTLLGALVELGYAASRDDANVRTSLAPLIAPTGRPEAVLVDPATGVIRLPVGTALDPGGLGKGLAADIVVEELLTAGAAGALVVVGGDLRVAGTPPDGTWPIEIEGHPARRVQLLDGGVATSTSRLRTWWQGGVERHHLLDPRTGSPTRGDVVSCTVIAGTAAWAEAFTKIAFTDGVGPALDRYHELGLAASITTDDGARHDTTPWKEFCR